jgi:hypothetical protein
LPPAVDGVLRRGMAKEPDQRYPTSRAFVDALLGALDGDPTAVTEPLRGGRRGVGAAGGAADGAAVAGAAAAGAGPARAPVARAPAGTARADRTAATTPLRSSAAERTPPNGRAFALAALAVVAIGVIVLISQMGASSTPSAKVSSGTHSTATRGARHRTRPKIAASSSSSTTAPLSSTASTSAAGASSPSQLQLLGHQQLLSGNYPAAIATLRRALAEANPNSLTYAYALYDLGDALLLSGNPKAAVPVLEQRLKIPNQTATVQALLNKALQEAGMPPQGSPGAQATTGGASVPPGHHKGHGHGGGNGQGD